MYLFHQYLYLFFSLNVNDDTSTQSHKSRLFTRDRLYDMAVLAYFVIILVIKQKIKDIIK